MTKQPSPQTAPKPQPDVEPAVRYIDLWEQNLSLIATRGHPDAPPKPETS